ncbi:membrane protein [Streptomyces bikiniensis]|uniref:membrane protein n=1 Tax=Streptomyces bikiniensis TaxID=1896 RepID=UPI0004C1956C|nr:membrane protein [Streptomyces bikiniensis]
MNDTPGRTSPGSAPSGDQNGSGVPRPAGPADVNGSTSQWSKDQPPAGRWSPPTGQTPPPGPGRNWGAPSSPAQWGRPPAAKPGVIPLRPLSMGEILDSSVKTLRTYWRTVLPVMAVLAVLTQVTQTLVQRYLVPPAPQVDPDATPSEALKQLVDSIQASLAGFGPSMLVSLAALLISSALLAVVVGKAALGRPITLGAAWREARPHLLRLLGLTLLLAVLGAAIMTVGLLPGLLIGGVAGAALVFLGGLGALVLDIWLMVRFSLSSPALILERGNVVQSLKRSAKLVQGSWWRIFGITLLTQLLVFVFAMIIAIPFAVIGLMVDGEALSGLLSGSPDAAGWPFLIVTGIGGVITSAITYPISAGVTVLLYVDQRIRREALDLELIRAAGRPDPGPAPGTRAVGG